MQETSLNFKTFTKLFSTLRPSSTPDEEHYNFGSFLFSFNCNIRKDRQTVEGANVLLDCSYYYFIWLFALKVDTFTRDTVAQMQQIP